MGASISVFSLYQLQNEAAKCNRLADLEKQGTRDVSNHILNLRIAAKRLYRAAKESYITFEKYDRSCKTFRRCTKTPKKLSLISLAV